MNHSVVSIKYRDSDLIINLFAQRTKILTRLIDNKNVSSIKPENTSAIHYLQQEYNRVTDQITQLEHNPLSDPMKVLPLELCADIIKESINIYDPVDELLDLTTVSQRWCNIIISLPTLWTTIVFDSTRSDYLAKAGVALSLSGTCELSVKISVPFELWSDVSPIILTESGRIVSLRIDDHPLDTIVSERILNDFKQLPVLKSLFLPTEFNPGRCDSRSRNIEFEKMPLLSTIAGPRPQPLDYSCSRFIRSRTIFVPEITQDMVNVWSKLSNLINLTILEREVLPGYSPKAFSSSLPSVQIFVYYGEAPKRALNLLGPNVTSITVEVHNFRQILDILGRFPQICDLALVMPRAFNYGTMDVGTTQASYKLVKRLKIHGDMYYQMEVTQLENAITSLGPLYQAFINILPCVRSLVLGGTLFIDETWSFISSLKQLHDLEVSHCEFHLSNSRSVVNMDYLSSVIWPVEPDSVFFCSKIVAPSLRSFQIHIIAAEWTSVGADSMDYCIPETAFPNLASLTIIISKSLTWNIGICKSLRKLTIHSQIAYEDELMTGSEILEAILRRPRDFPALETIELGHLLFEYDILLLLLERKNINAQPGISPITTIFVNSPLSYRLLYPITTLLRGKFPDREPNVAFSLIAVGQRMFDELS
ncbi:hypothetical protein M408DRAFT_29998 [Serendipita vermifera MAFF 305830]|uniref:Uncharacterized protein n=1 Tax=Serendipita vermifera MAFF 305830 TaxID=933852 RepID=A0A0C2WTU7_SERVB|nr:hypothetical protein M408DRAFT_29998 [Serendipita vermifera MAFF 305830]